MGKMICPFAIMIGATTTGSVGNEGEIIKRTLPSCIIIIFILGFFTWFSCYVFPVLNTKL